MCRVPLEHIRPGSCSLMGVGNWECKEAGNMEEDDAELQKGDYLCLYGIKKTIRMWTAKVGDTKINVQRYLKKAAWALKRIRIRTLHPSWPLWHKDYFEQKANKSRHRKNSFCLLLFCLTAGHKFPFMKVFPPLLSSQGEEYNPYHSRWTVSTEVSLQKQPSLK